MFRISHQREKIRNMSIRRKLLIRMYFIALIVGVISTAASLAIQIKLLERQQTQAYVRTTQVMSQNIDSMGQDALDIGTYFVVNTKIGNVLRETKMPENRSAMFWAAETDLQSMQDILAIKSNVKTIGLYPENGLDPYTISRDGSVYNTDLNEIHQLTVYAEAGRMNGDVYWSCVPKGSTGLYVRNLSSKITASREIYDLSKKRRLGFLTISIDLESVAKSCRKMRISQDDAVLLLDQSGQTVFRIGDVDRDLEKQVASRLHQAKGNLPEGRLRQGKYYYFLEGSSTGLVSCYITPRQNWINEAIQSSGVAVTSLILLLLLIGMIPMSAYISGMIVKPLEELEKSMKQFRKGDFHAEAEVTSGDEIGMLAGNFNHMVNDIRELVDKNYVMTLRQKEMELNTLQSQINPHFLYNVMDSLYWQAVEQDAAELAEDILTLSRLFRLILSHGQSEIPVRREIELISCYLQIQKMRFSKRLEYHIDVEPEVLDCRISKLMLQPFVENAVVHGLESREKGGCIWVSGRKIEDRILFIIRDNGTGMEASKAEELRNVNAGDGVPGNGNDERIGHYAISNVKQRLMLEYGSNFRLDIESRPGHGTVVALEIPYTAFSS